MVVVGLGRSRGVGGRGRGLEMEEWEREEGGGSGSGVQIGRDGCLISITSSRRTSSWQIGAGFCVPY